MQDKAFFLDIHEKKNEKKKQFGYYLVCLLVFVFVLCFVFDTIIKNVVINFLMFFFFNTYIPETCYFTSETIYTVLCKKLTVHKTNRFDHKSNNTVQKLIVLFTNEPCRVKGVPDNSCKTLTKTTKNLLYRTKSVQHAYTVY